MFMYQESNPFKNSCIVPKIKNRMEAMIKKDFFLKIGLQHVKKDYSPDTHNIWTDCKTKREDLLI